MSNSSTKCPICNTQNDPDATACQQCGFGFSLTQPLWPDYNLDVAPGEPTAPKPSKKPEPPEKQEPPPLAPRPLPPVETVDNDALARAHIADGVRAMRAGAPGQAQQEFEQALELANDPAIVRSAQKRLNELSGELDEAARLPARLETPPAPRPSFDSLTTKSPPAPRSTEDSTELRSRSRQARPSENLGWMSALRLGLTLGFVNGVLTGCGAIFCVGFFFAPLFGLLAGWWVAKQAEEHEWPTQIGHALLAGALVGLGAGLGQLVGFPLWLRDTPDLELNTVFYCITCCLGATYAAITIILSALGWRFKTLRKS